MLPRVLDHHFSEVSMSPVRSRAMALFLVTVVVLGACTSRGRSTVSAGPSTMSTSTTTLAVKVCDRFAVTTTPISVDASGGTFAIPPGHVLQFAPGSVTEPRTFEARLGPNGGPNGNHWAEIELRPTDGKTTDFDVPVRLRLSYALCQWTGPMPRLRVVQSDVTPPINVGGADAPRYKFVDVLLEHFTAYAIAN
jgi:hypothetical protein